MHPRLASDLHTPQRNAETSSRYRLGVAVLCLCVLIAVSACGASRSAHVARFTPHTVYSIGRVETCLVSSDIRAARSQESQLIAPLNQLPNITGAIDISAGGEFAPGVLSGRAMDSGLLLFVTTSAMAYREEPAAWHTFNDRLRISFGSKPLPKPTASQAATLQRVYGNVIVLWEFPRKYPRASDKVIRNCLRQAQGVGGSKPPAHTQVDRLTPFEFNGKPMPQPRPFTVPGTCRPGSDLLIVNVYTCTSIPSGQPGCSKGCIYQACWRDPGTATRTMTCLLSPFVDPQLGATVATSEVRIIMRNHPAVAKRASDPTAAEPWGLVLANGDICSDAFGEPGGPAGAPIAYSCTGAAAPPSRLDRHSPLWTLQVTQGRVTRPIAIREARFADNGP